MSDGMRREIEEALDFFESLSADDALTVGEFVETYPDEQERSRICDRLYQLGPALVYFALAVWPSDAKPSETVRA